MHSTNEVVRIKHREFLGNINGSILFNNTSFNINPGLSATFPWLYTTAMSFEQYKINGMIVEFVSTCGDAIASTNNTLGTVCLSTDYNVVNDDFDSMAKCQNSMWSSTGKPSKNIVMPIECDGKLNVLERLFIRDNQLSLSNSDLRLYDHCKINIATEGMQVATQIGQIWISYDISFYKPVLHDVLTNPSAHYYLGAYSNGFFTNYTKKYDNLKLSLVSVNNNRVIFNKLSVGKNYMVFFVIYATSGTYNWAEFNYTLSGCTNYNIINNGVSN